MVYPDFKSVLQLRVLYKLQHIAVDLPAMPEKRKKRRAFCSGADQYFGLRRFAGQWTAALRHADDRRRAADSCLCRF